MGTWRDLLFIVSRHAYGGVKSLTDRDLARHTRPHVAGAILRRAYAGVQGMRHKRVAEWGAPTQRVVIDEVPALTLWCPT